MHLSQFGFRARHSTTLQCMRLTDHVTPNFNNDMSTLRYSCISKRPLIIHGTLACYINYLNGIFDQFDLGCWLFSFEKNIRSSVEGEMSTPREMQAAGT
jgi:hypothetical protein